MIVEVERHFDLQRGIGKGSGGDIIFSSSFNEICVPQSLCSRRKRKGTRLLQYMWSHVTKII
jgi:hypothetical protein